MRRSYLSLAAMTLVVAACDAGPAEPDDSLAPLAELYLQRAVDIMETNSIKRYEIDWDAFRAETIADAGAARSAAETYPAIIDALERIGDNHSFFRGPGGQQLAPTMSSSDEPATTDPMSELLDGDVGYVDVPEFSGGGTDADDLASEYHRLIEGVDTLATTCRWVIDLRGNTGGNMWPMIAGIGPILGEDTVGFFVDPDSLINVWYYEDGRAGIDNLTFTTAGDPYELAFPLPHVAVLTDGETASSGEAVAVAFRGRADARSFGEETWGVSTANSAFPLSDGAVIFLTVTTMADRAGTIYGNELVPDEVIIGGTKTGDPATDVVLDAAMQWLLAQTCS